MENFDFLPEKTKKLVPFLIEQNWLETYQTIEGIEHILWQMSHRIKFRLDLSKAINELRLYYSDFETEFFDFMEEVQLMCKEKLKELG
jgi:acyl carrier protein phosphodiesterase